jgi:hypothetical protein
MSKMNINDVLLKLKGWQRLWAVFSIFCLFAAFIITLIYFPSYDRCREEYEGEGLQKACMFATDRSRAIVEIYGNPNEAREEHERRMISMHLRQLDYVFVCIVGYLVFIAAVYSVGIAVAWVIKGFKDNH